MCEPTHASRRDPSSVENLFAQRLSQAVAQRGLSLHRIVDRLTAASVKVSVATLSYWSSGRSRPTRARSQQVLPVLEQVLGVPSGWLTEALPAERANLDVGGLLGKREQLHRVLDEMGLPGIGMWKRLMVHRTSILGSDRREREAVTSQVSRAEANDAQGWTTVVEADGGGQVRMEAMLGMRVVRSVLVPDTATTLVEVRLPHPLQRGECALTTHRSLYGPGREEATCTGFAVTRQVDLLALEAVFQGPSPQLVQRVFQDPDQGLAPTVQQQVGLDANRACCVIPKAVPGIHTLTWQW